MSGPTTQDLAAAQRRLMHAVDHRDAMRDAYRQAQADLVRAQQARRDMLEAFVGEDTATIHAAADAMGLSKCRIYALTRKYC